MKHKSDNPIVFLTRKLWEHSKGNRHNVVLYVTLFVIANGIYLLEPLVIARILNGIQEQGITSENMPTLLGLLSLIIVINIAFWLFHGPARVIENKNAFLARASYKKELLEGTMNLPPEWHTDHHSGDTIDKIEKGTKALYNYASSTFETIGPIVTLSGAYIALALFNIHSAYVVAIMVTLVFVLVTQMDKILIRQYRILNKAENKISAHIFDTISNITTVIILRVEKLLAKAIVRTIMEPLSLYVRNNKINEIKWFLVSVATSLMTFLVLGSYIFLNVATGTAVLIGTVYALYGYVNRINSLFYNFAYRYSDIVQQRTAVQNAEEISNEFTSKIDYGNAKLPFLWREITIQNLQFSYHTEEGADLHLDNVSMTLKKNSRTALVGASGSGKSTLLKIIRDLYTPNEGQVFVDDRELEHGFASISEDIALIPQDPEIFSTTIRENITLGLEYGPQKIKEYTDMAMFSDVIERLPNGLGSSIVEKGVNLSGGEKQRLALARGLLASEHKAIVLLDEPSSSVDTENELHIYKNIFDGFSNKTIVSSVHRLHLLSLFDVVYYFDDGQLKDFGTFDELLKTSDSFKELWDQYQASQDVQ